MIVRTQNVIQITLTLNEAEIFAGAIECAFDSDKNENLGHVLRRSYKDNEIALLTEIAYEVRKAT